LRRVILAFATRIASALVGFCFGAVCFSPLTAGIFGSTGVGIAQARSVGWVLIGPVVGLFFAIKANSCPPFLFTEQGLNNVS
jgi:hypothetical protein